MVKNHFGKKLRLEACLIRVVALLLVLWGGYALAASGSGDVPESLKPWKAWVLHGHEAWLCPDVEGEHNRAFCAWPGELRLEIARQGGSMKFSQNWELQYESAVPLPGNREYWPQQVVVNGRVHPVLMRNGVPIVWLTQGRHAVSGWISWPERPQAMDIPENVALVSLVVDGKPVLPLERHGRALMLGMQEDTAAREGDSLDIQVVRKLSDGIPARLTTRIHLKVSGKAREWSMPDILPAHFVPMRLTSPWAARLDANGGLQVQVMPGQAMIEVEARLDEPLKNVVPVFSSERQQEVWSYEARPDLRATMVSPEGNMLNVDPRQAGVSADWLSLPAFAVNPGARFQIEERSRGQNEHESQRLSLKRDLWLDFSGKGFFVRDRIEGTMRQGWRFDVAFPYTLERADSLAVRARGASDDLSAALLVTRGADETLTGVEWRQPNVTLNASARLEASASSRVPVTGWQYSFDRVDTTLRLPYGYQLIAAPGADSVSDNVWLERWTILSVFLAALFAMLAWRLLGAAGGVAAVVYFALAMHESFAPLYSFAAVVILALICRAVPEEGRLRKALLIGERIALLSFICVAIAFIPMQIRTALYPQLEGDSEAGITPAAAMFGNEPAAERRREIAVQKEEEEDDDADAEIDPETLADIVGSPPKPAMALSLPAPESVSSKMQRQDASLPSQFAQAQSQRQRYAQSTVTQTGGGEPAWELGHRYRLHWSGPITEAQSVRLLISPPWLTRLLRLLSVVLLGWLAWRLIRVAFSAASMRLPWKAPRAKGGSTAATLCLVGLIVAGSGFSTSADAAPGDGAFPPNDLLEKLKTRLLEAPACAPVCANVDKVRIDADASRLKAMLVAHVEAATSLALPKPDEQMALHGVRINGQVLAVLHVKGKNFITLPRGVHYVQLEYVIDGDAASLSFPVRPAQVEFSSAHWRVDGIDEGHLLGETLNFSRVATIAPPVAPGSGAGVAAASSAQQFPPFVHVQRDLVFDLDWSVQTQVTRIAPKEGGFTFPVPLLLGEHVTTAETKVQDGRALAVFSTRANSASWAARLDKAKNVIELRAPPLAEYAETWRVIVNPSWHLELEGVPVTLGSNGEDVIFEFHPLPGEKLTLTLTQPTVVEGGIRAIDRVRLENHVGQHASDIMLEFSLRASQGGEHSITLPLGLEVLEVRRGGMPLNLQPRENHLSLPVSPGAQTYMLRLRRQGETGFSTSSPDIGLGLPSANIDLRTILGNERWVIGTRGPAVGPAVLYWGELLVALLLAFLLAKSSISSLKYWQWFLLVLGFSTFSWMALLIIALWLIVVEWRLRSESCLNWPPHRFNAMQAGIVILTFLMLNELVASVKEGLLGVPDMGIRGYRSSGNDLAWFADRSDSLLPTAQVFSLPIWLYRALMLAWTLWLASILIRWLGLGLSAWVRNGYWKKTGWAWKKKGALPPAAQNEATGSEKHDRE